MRKHQGGLVGSVNLVWTTFSITNSPPVRSQQCPKVRRVLFVTPDAWQCALDKCKICATARRGELRFHIWNETAWEGNTDVIKYSQSPSLSLSSAGTVEIHVEADSSKKGCSLIATSLEVHVWETERFYCSDALEYGGERMLVSMATSV